MTCEILRGALATMLSVAASGAVALGAQSPAPVTVIELGPYPSTTRAFTVRASVGGHDGVFLWDTGEGVSMITPAFAQRVDCKPWGQVTGYRMTGDRIDAPHCDDLAFDVRGTRLPAPSVIVYDVSKFTSPGAPPLDGALGLDLFAGRAITFQLTRGTITVESPASLAARVPRATEVPVRLVRDGEGLSLTVNLGVPTPSGMAWMELDSGNSGPSMFIARYLAAQFQVDTMRQAPQAVQLTIGGRVPVRTVARTLPRMAIDGNLGVTFLREWDVTLDLVAGRAWLTSSSQP